MNLSHLKYLSDPLTGKKFSILTFKKNGNSITEGLLISGKNSYPIINGIPRILLGDYYNRLMSLYPEYFSKYQKRISGLSLHTTSTEKFVFHQNRTAGSFAFEWNQIYQENSQENSNYFHFLSPFIKPSELTNKVILDAGCGSGRFTKQAASSGAKLVIAADLGESVEIAGRMCQSFKNVLIVQCDIYHMPFLPVFDLVQCIGVLHHLPEPENGFRHLVKLVKPGGSIIIWVYNRRNNNRALYFYEPLRYFTRQIPAQILFYLCYIPAFIVHAINIFSRGSEKFPFYYYYKFPFNMKLNDAFDVLSTPKSNYYFVEQIRDWFSHAKLTRLRSFEHAEAGITCIGTVNNVRHSRKD